MGGISIGTYDDLKGWDEPRPIDRNPDIPCDECGESFAWADYWKPRGQDPTDSFDPEAAETWRCDDCRARLERLRRRRENNHSLWEYENDA